MAIPAVHEVAELEAVGVILAQRLEKQVSFLAWSVLRGVHHQVGACSRVEKRVERGVISWFCISQALPAEVEKVEDAGL